MEFQLLGRISGVAGIAIAVAVAVAIAVVIAIFLSLPLHQSSPIRMGYAARLQPGRKTPWDRPALLILPVLLALFAHWPAISGGFTNWDDPGYLLFNPLTRDPLQRGLAALLLTPDIGYPIPVTILFYAAEHAVFGLDPSAFHATSLVLHLIVITLACTLARRMGASWPAAALAGTVFAVHPLVVEPVAWVVGQKDLLATALLLAALLTHAGSTADAIASSRKTRLRHILVLILVVLALAAKPSAVAAPALLMGLDAALGRALKPRAWLYATVAALALITMVLAILGHETLDAGPSRHAGLDSILETGWAFALQVRHIVWPVPLLARYFAPTGLALWIWAGLGFILAIAITVLIVRAWRRGHAALAFGLGGALIAYAPVSGLIPLSRGPADSYCYLPLTLAVIALAHVFSRCTSMRHVSARIGLVAMLLLVMLLSVFARAQARMWRDAPTLWAQVLRAYPDEPRALMRMGDAFAFTRRPDVALHFYEQLRQRHPGFTTSLPAHGQTLEQLGRLAEADAVLAEAAQVPAFAEIYAWFLVANPDIEPADTDMARRALVTVVPLLAERGKRPSSLRRAAELLERFGEPDHARALRRRLLVLEKRGSAP